VINEIGGGRPAPVRVGAPHRAPRRPRLLAVDQCDAAHRWSLLLGLADNAWQTGEYSILTQAMGQGDPTALEVANLLAARACWERADSR
jgi:hypothetical protein